MNSKLRSTLSGLSVMGIFLGLALLLAQPLPANVGAPSAASLEASQGSDVTFSVDHGLGTVKLNLTLPYYAVGKLLATQTES
ncbi:MAG: hypothetical protein R3F12_14450 [Lysobacteraceae bacterium]|nr:hypothetical protein [Xanthomonadales bacterium]HPF74869.1 hypothetical protein [Xanthomonadaceae bacterium]HRY01318.1 hypothetical protein [Xanthomonadaceae bacterium]